MAPFPVPFPSLPASLPPELQRNQDAIRLGLGGVTSFVAFTAMVLANSWVASGGAAPTPGYVKDALGFVHLRGSVKNGSAATAAVTTLPAGFRPGSTEDFVVSGNGAFAVCRVTAAGVVSFPTGGSVTATTLNGIIYRAEG